MSSIIAAIMRIISRNNPGYFLFFILEHFSPSSSDLKAYPMRIDISIVRFASRCFIFYYVVC